MVWLARWCVSCLHSGCCMTTAQVVVLLCITREYAWTLSQSPASSDQHVVQAILVIKEDGLVNGLYAGYEKAGDARMAERHVDQSW
jgi:hypothetical protein